MVPKRSLGRHSLAAAALLASQGCASTIAPPEPVAPYVVRLDRLREPPLWAQAARQGYRTRLRLSIQGIIAEQAVIRIDERADGRLSGIVSTMGFDPYTGRSLPGTIRRRVFSLDAAAWRELLQAVERARMFRLYPEFWVDADPEALCIDGMELLFERGDASGYRFSHANAQCTAPPAVREVARQLIELSRERRLLGWLS